MAGSERFDAIVIGSGQGGVPLARAFAGAGRRTAIVERGAIGGSCVNFGCTPTKTLYASAQLAARARRAREYGIVIDGVRADLAAVKRRKDEVVAAFRSGTEAQLAATANLEVVRGHARFAGREVIEVESSGAARKLEAPLVVINTGTRSARPKIAGLEHANAVDATGMMELEQAPERLVVIGGGYIGLELGQIYARLGSRVTIVQRSPQLLPQEDTDVAEAIAAIFREEGIEVVLSADTKRVRPGAGGAFTLELASPTGEHVVDGDLLLLAAGRRPNTDDLALERCGVEVDDRGFVRANERLETNVPGVYALGDVKGGPAFTHISFDDHRVLKTNLIDGGRATITGRLVPYTVFIDPQLGRVGLTEKEARAQGLAFRVAKTEMANVARAHESGEGRGFMKALVEEGTERILGCAILGMEGGELMAMLELAMLGGLTAPKLRDAIFAHPTLAEGLNTLFG